MLELPEVDSEGQRARLQKEILELEKLIRDKDRQLSNDKFLNGAPVHVVDSLRVKRAEYVAQRDKSQAALSDLK
jgi:valyl-tRNA synthetase